MRTSRMVSSRFSPVKPGAMAAISQGVASTPSSVKIVVTSETSPATAPATLRASSSRPSARSAAYTGMNEALRTPSPSRFCRKLGILNAAL